MHVSGQHPRGCWEVRHLVANASWVSTLAAHILKECTHHTGWLTGGFEWGRNTRTVTCRWDLVHFREPLSRWYCASSADCVTSGQSDEGIVSSDRKVRLLLSGSLHIHLITERFIRDTHIPVKSAVGAEGRKKLFNFPGKILSFRTLW